MSADDRLPVEFVAAVFPHRQVGCFAARTKADCRRRRRLIHDRPLPAHKGHAILDAIVGRQDASTLECHVACPEASVLLLQDLDNSPACAKFDPHGIRRHEVGGPRVANLHQSIHVPIGGGQRVTGGDHLAVRLVASVLVPRDGDDLAARAQHDHRGRRRLIGGLPFAIRERQAVDASVRGSQCPR